MLMRRSHSCDNSRRRLWMEFFRRRYLQVRDVIVVVTFSLALHIIRKYCLYNEMAVAEVVIISKVVDALCR